MKVKDPQNVMLMTSKSPRTDMLDQVTYHIAIKLQFPHCDDESAISVSCLDLYYSVTLYKESKDLKDEKNDKTAPLVLHNLEEDDTDSSGWSHMHAQTDRQTDTHTHTRKPLLLVLCTPMIE